MSRLTKTTSSLRPGQIDKKWIVIDAEDAVVGRLAAFIAVRLRGKHRPDYTPHTDCGDHVVVVNAGKVKLTGRKLEQKAYFRHTGYPGGLKKRTAGQMLTGKYPERVLEKAVERMLPKESALARMQLSHLRIYAGEEHPHGAQQPQPVDFGGANPKNLCRGSLRFARAAGHALSNRGGGDVFDFDALRADVAEGASMKPGRLDQPSDLAAIAGKIERLLLDLDHSEPAARRKALLLLAELLPKLDVGASLTHQRLRQAVRAVPDRLVQALAENLPFPDTAKAAAMAIAACVRPENYRSTPVVLNEEQALADLEKVLDACRIDSFSMVQLAQPEPSQAIVEAQLWNGLPFTLAGRYPDLPTAPWLRPKAGMGIQLFGAEAVEVAPTERHKLHQGQLAGVRASLRPSSDEDNVVLYLTHDDLIFDRYVYDRDALFGGAEP